MLQFWAAGEVAIPRSIVFLVVLALVTGWGCRGNDGADTMPDVPGAVESRASDVANPPPDESGPPSVVNYTRIDATVACAGATPPEAIRHVKDLGFVSVLNVRTVGERGARVEEGRAAAEAAGLRYFHLPFRDATPEVAESFLETVTNVVNQPVYIHCSSANRVAALWLIKRVRVDGWTVADATAEAEAIGLRSETLKAFATAYVGTGGA